MTTRFIGHLLTGTHAARPAASAVPEGTLYSCTTHNLIYQSDTATWATWLTAASGSVATDAIWDAAGDLALGTGANTAARLAIGTSGYVLTSNGTTAAWAAAAGADDPVADIFGTPDTAYEFDTSSLTGLTAIGTPTTEAAHTTVPGHYYVTKAATSSVAMCGRWAAVSAPFTAITKVSGYAVIGADFIRTGGLFTSTSSPGAVESIHHVHAVDWTVAHERYSNPTTYDTTIGTNHPTKGVLIPVWYGVVANSTTDLDYWYSFDGRIWRKRTDARDPGITVGSVGIIIDPSNATYAAAAAFDYLRIWNSVETFPGV